MSNSIVEPQNSGFIKEEGIEFFEQLIILGNGFDLACGLKSSYLDFFNYIFKKVIKTIIGIEFSIILMEARAIKIILGLI
jgi:hypothetical protein